MKREIPPLEWSLRSALFWAAAFSFSIAIYLPATKLLRGIPPPDPLAIGRVTIDAISKPREYAGAILFYLLVPLLTVVLRGAFERFHDRLAGAAGERSGLASIALFAFPYLIAPFLFLTTRKEMWGIALPLLLCTAGPIAFRLQRSSRWFRRLFDPSLSLTHALLLAQASGWILFRYLVTGKRIAHIPTLFLEIPFVLLFLALFWTVMVLIARASALVRGGDAASRLRSIALGATPLLLLPLLAFAPAGGLWPATVVWLIGATGVAAAASRRPASPGDTSFDDAFLRRLLSFLIVPLFLFLAGWASNTHLDGWLDLFHRGESLGPASDYLQGKIPYRDVFVLHGMLEDGLLDAWLMDLLGRELVVSNARMIAMNSLVIVASWFLGLALFRSIPLALTTVGFGLVTFVENPRILMEIVVATLLLVALQRSSRALLVLAGVASGIALFYSLDIGLYSIGGSLFTIALWSVWRREALRSAWQFALFLAGLALGAAPFLLWLNLHGAAGDFFRVSFVEVPRFIDPVWSLPFPDLAARFMGDLSLRGLADIFLTDRFRFLLNPLVIGVAVVVLIAAFRRRSADDDILPLILLTSFALVTQRSALGRADFQHQYFSAFLIAPLMVLLFIRLWMSASSVFRREGIGGRVALAALLVAALPLIATALWIPDLLNARLDAILSYRRPVESRDERIVRERAAAVVASVNRLASPGAFVFDFSNQPAFYYLTGRMNPTRFYQVPILSPPRFQREVLADLEASRVELVFRSSPERYDRFDGIPNHLRAQAVDAYIRDHFQIAEIVRGVEIWERRDGLAPASPETFLSRIGLPEVEALALPERLIYPAVGSSVGAAASYWVSDLFIHNPSEKPAHLSLRYLSNRGIRDRGVRLAPAQSMSLPDFPRKLFALPESRGALRVDSPPGKAIVIQVRTYDAARASTRTLTPPLRDPEDIAVSGTERNELLLTGLQGGTGRRVNAGVVNAGVAPLHVRIYATEGGTVVGRATEWHVAEGASQVMVDVSQQLDISVTESTAIHLTVLDGAAVGYGTVIDGLTGSHEVVPAAVGRKP
ncbi:MAG TPA: hypothetical protein VM557_00830 [Thermoanaerobaculia bacterium]|nr:hypothetical protein [Thermoanaerobaculia bacterium]